MKVCVCAGDLCEGVRVGREYSVIGVPVHTLTEATSRPVSTVTLEVLKYRSFSQLREREREVVAGK